MTILSTILIVFIFIIFLAVIIFVFGGFLNKICQPIKIYIQLENLSKEFDVIINSEKFLIPQDKFFIEIEVGIILLFVSKQIKKNIKFCKWTIKREQANEIINKMEKYFIFNNNDKDDIRNMFSENKISFKNFLNKIIEIIENKGFNFKAIEIQPSKYTFWGLLFADAWKMLKNIKKYKNKEVFDINIINNFKN